ncbi:MAG: two-component system phosphate regulon sensor histidine kinase PhoR [Crocinitomix sp.]|jgi:two-component system phosphate regulon sensor histidine kinase PhoR
MNLSKPIYIALTGSMLLGLLLTIILVIINNVSDAHLSAAIIILIILSTIALSFLIFTFLVRRFLSEKIKVIYGIITNEQVSEIPEVNFSDDTLAKLTEDSVEYATVQKKQISELKKQAAFRKEFLGNLAHELKTPVFSIQGYVLTLLEGGLEDGRVNRDFLERALSGVDRISNLLEDLDDIAKLETDRFKLNLVKCDFVKLVQEVFQELETKANHKNIKLKFDKHYDPTFVLADANRIMQVLVNLVSNSISYGIGGGETTVSIISYDKKKILIEVSDNGVGMAQEHIPRLFERFYRVDKSRERNIGGSGLGLAIVKHVLEVHKQTLTVRSTVGIGSTFSFTLDLV